MNFNWEILFLIGEGNLDVVRASNFDSPLTAAKAN
jgi:hypothetical protein